MSNATIDTGWDKLWLYFVYSGEGIVIGLSNLLIALSILRYQALRRTKEYTLMMGLALADTCNMAGYVACGIYRVHLVFTGRHHTMRSSWECITTVHNLLWTFAEPLAGLILVIISLDRLLAVSIPLKYINFTRTYALCLLIPAYIYCFLTGTVASLSLMYFQSETVLVSATCYSGGWALVGVNDLYVSYFQSAAVSFATLSCVLYLGVGVVYRRQVAKVKPSGQSASQNKKLEQQRRLTISLGMSCLCTFFFYVIPFSMGYVFFWNGFSTLAVLGWASSNLNPLFNVFIYPLRHKEVKMAIKSFLGCRGMPAHVSMWKTGAEHSAPHSARVDVSQHQHK